MKSDLLQTKSNGLNQSREVVDSQRENIGASLPWWGHQPPPNPVNPAVDQAQEPLLPLRVWQARRLTRLPSFSVSRFPWAIRAFDVL
jgi:hypothetical protein